MRVRRIWSTVLVAIFAIGSAHAEPKASGAKSHAETPRLFDAQEPLAIDIEADWRSVQRDRDAVRNTYPATLSYTAASGAVSLPIELETRGRSRLLKETCTFPPLLLGFSKESRKGTLFRGIGELKLVTHCQTSVSYEQNLLLEYLVYRSYALLTDHSYRVRLLHVRYLDPGGKKPRIERFGFVIEDASNLAKRLHGESVRESTIDPSQLDAAAASRAEMFFYMIGMTDFSMVARPDGPCCHNARALRVEGGALIPVPFDFDQTGVVDPKYALPDPRLKLRGVTQRKFRGVCREPAMHEVAIAQLREKRAEMTALFEAQEGLASVRRQKALAYLDEFFRWASDPARVRKTLTEECRQTSA